MTACLDFNHHVMSFEDDTCVRCGFVWPAKSKRRWDKFAVWINGYPTQDSDKREQHYETYRRRVRVKYPPKSVCLGRQREM